MKKYRKIKLMEICLLTAFVIVLLTSVFFNVALNMPQISLALLLVGFPIAIVAAIFASLSIRAEEEEKSS